MGERRAERRRYFTGERREVYLDCLRVTACHRAAAREAGVSERAARRYRARKAEFEALCVEAEREARRRLAGAEHPFEEALDPTFQSIRRGPEGKAKIVKTPGGRWTVRTEERFFAVLTLTGNIAASARAVGFSREAIGKRRRKWPAFARRMEETMEEAEIDLEFRLLGMGTGWSEGVDAEGGGAAPAPAAPLDPDFALKFLKWREEKKRGVRASVVAFPSAEEVRERIIAKVMAVKKHREAMARRAEQAPEEGEGC